MTFTDQHHAISVWTSGDALGPSHGMICNCEWASNQHFSLINLLNAYGEHITMATFDTAAEIMKVDDVTPTPTVRGAIRLYRFLTGRTGDGGDAAPPPPPPHQPTHYPTTARRF